MAACGGDGGKLDGARAGVECERGSTAGDQLEVRREGCPRVKVVVCVAAAADRVVCRDRSI